MKSTKTLTKSQYKRMAVKMERRTQTTLFVLNQVEKEYIESGSIKSLTRYFKLSQLLHLQAKACVRLKKIAYNCT